jgi:hypothetical protein
LLFGSNVLSTYKLNNPGEIQNQQFNNKFDAITGVLKGILATGVGLVSVKPAIAAYGLLGLGETTSGILRNNKNLKHNIASMKAQPPISSGTGSAQMDMYFNRKGFSLNIAK